VSDEVAVSTQVSSAVRASRYRWVIAALLFAATAINYVDRQSIGILKPTLARQLHWSEQDYANIIFWFQVAYAVGYVSFGRVVDRLGTKLGYGLAVAIWTLAHFAHAAVFTVSGFAAARFGLGIGESGSFPAGIKAVSEWFPQRDRALAIGLFNAGANVGAIVTPLIIPWLTLTYGWRTAIVSTGFLGFAWLALWFALYRRPEAHKRVNAAELAYIRQDPPYTSVPIPWHRLLGFRETWAYAVGKFFIDPIWWFFLFWLPAYLARHFGLDLRDFGPPLIVIYILSDVGSVLGGWASGRLIRSTGRVNFARKTTMFLCACAVLPILLVQSVHALWPAVLLIGLATAAHQAFSANLFAFPSDVFPQAAVGSVVGIGGTAGAIGGMLMAKATGFILGTFHSYTPLFLAAGGIYFVALLAVQILSPRMARVVAG
jgi:MFS transporter, ACS family, hexuronate transporter